MARPSCAAQHLALAAAFIFPGRRSNVRGNILEGANPLTTYSCTQPPPQTLSYFNPELNATTYQEIPVKVHEIAILYNYELRHASGVEWTDIDQAEAKKGFFQTSKEKVGSFFENLFGSNEDEEEEVEPPQNDGVANEKLAELEMFMVNEMWKELLGDTSMGFEGDSESEKCTGLTIQDDVLNRELQMDEVNVNVGDDTMLEAESPKLNLFEGTKLLGLSSEPSDLVAIDGCASRSDTCTRVLGRTSVAYAGANEYAIVQLILELLQRKMADGTFENGDALSVEFISSDGTASLSETETLTHVTARGTAIPQDAPSEEDNISKYGKLFVSLVAILGIGAIVSRLIKRRRRRKLQKAGEELHEEYSVDDEEVNAAETGKTEEDSGGSSRSSPAPQPQSQEDIKFDIVSSQSGDISRVASETDEFEISLSPTNNSK
mmetsp:Transcript_29325/g.65728  ORF Transcript_29325/g.65728 Transcript_29325/m.65728 type:complete len:434 (+) Transcript_29325:162-1463(+)